MSTRDRILAVLLHAPAPLTAAAVHWHVRPIMPIAEVHWHLESLKAAGLVISTRDDEAHYTLTLAARMDLWENYQGDRWSWAKATPWLVVLCVAGWLVVLWLAYLIKGAL